MNQTKHQIIEAFLAENKDLKLTSKESEEIIWFEASPDFFCRNTLRRGV